MPWRGECFHWRTEARNHIGDVTSYFVSCHVKRGGAKADIPPKTTPLWMQKRKFLLLRDVLVTPRRHCVEEEKKPRSADVSYPLLQSSNVLHVTRHASSGLSAET